jgi:DNA-binding NarL/FixJ family response regulator
MKVLIVDDSKLARMAIARALSVAHPDWTRIEAANADEALMQIRTADPDIAVFDFNMPGRDGLELAAEARSLKPDMSVAVISANTQQEIVDRAVALGATFLNKPITEQAFADFLAGAATKLRASRQ